MKPLFEYQAAIFDLDGTLVDSMRVWEHLCRDWLLFIGKNPAPELERDIELMTLGQAAEYVRTAYGVALPPDEIIAAWQGMAQNAYQHTVALKPGAKELLYALKEAGLKLAVATSCFPASCEAVLHRYDLWRLFDAVVYSDEVARDKNHPDIWLSCAQRLGIAPEDCLVFEDLRAAGCGIRAAGMAFVAVYDDSCKDWLALQGEADVAVCSLAELL